MRVIATSGRNLYAQVKKDRFSMELYNMISRNKISIPQVSGVPEDIRFYFEKYLERYCGIYGQPPIRVGGEAWSFLERRRWEGGVQEIRETAERIVIQAEGRSWVWRSWPPSSRRRASGPRTGASWRTASSPSCAGCWARA